MKSLLIDHNVVAPFKWFEMNILFNQNREALNLYKNAIMQILKEVFSDRYYNKDEYEKAIKSIENALKFYPSFKSRELIPEIERLIKEDSI